jgi:DNA-binding winged helix-turn-helix (wHTH) protein
MNRVRAALRDHARKPSFIETVHGRGYRFIPQVKFIEAVDAAPGPDTPPATRGSERRAEGAIECSSGRSPIRHAAAGGRGCAKW